ncbi:MAG: hypothetical protein IJ083_12945 [Clostridia bacterium]|nr:hypothetical protein [Clostridia bacterium]
MPWTIWRRLPVVKEDSVDPRDRFGNFCLREASEKYFGGADMNAKQAARAAKKLEEQAKGNMSQTLRDVMDEVITPTEGREKLPGGFEDKYRSEVLKLRIADAGMWAMIPAVRCSMNSKEGIRRIKENDVLFSFIDQYFQDVPFAFEPNMQDGRYVCIPSSVFHQGIGICASKTLPGFLEIGHFWYPSEYTENGMLGIDQVYVAQYNTKPDLAFANKIRKLYTEDPGPKARKYCTFPFDPDTVLRFDGDFMEHVSKTSQTIRNALRGKSAQIQRNGEGLIVFMERIMR